MKAALALGLGVTVVAVVVVMSAGPSAVLASNSVTLEEPLSGASAGATACQAGERLPGGTRAIRLSLGAFTGPGVSVRALSGNSVLTSGAHGSGWDGRTVTIPVTPLPRTIDSVRICFTIERGEGVLLFGAPTGTATAATTSSGRHLAGRLCIEYLGSSHSSWLALASSVSRRMGLGRAWSGAWVSMLVALSMLAVAALSSRLILRELRG